MKWLQPKGEEAQRVANKVVLEQLLQMMPPKACHWVICWQPPRAPRGGGALGQFLSGQEEGSALNNLKGAVPVGPTSCLGQPPEGPWDG